VFWKPALFPFPGKETRSQVDPLDWAILNHWLP